MKAAAIGVRVHSGWGALLAVAGKGAAVEVLDRRRVVIADPNVLGACQPYHAAARMALPEATKYLSRCAEVSQQLALAAIHNVIEELHNREFQVVGAAVLLASGRPLPDLSIILTSHPLIHTAEGEFFRAAFSNACERLTIPVTRTRERDLDECAHVVFGKITPQVWARISTLQNLLGPPWTEDQKKATYAASIVLAAFEHKV